MKIDSLFVVSYVVLLAIGCKTAPAESDFVYWQNLSQLEQQRTLRLQGIDPVAVAHFQGILDLSYSQRTFAMLDSITSGKTIDENLTAFYFFLFNKICLTADSAIASQLGPYCQNVILRNPSYAFNYFLMDNRAMLRYAQCIGAELNLKQNGISTMRYGYDEFRQVVEKETGTGSRYRASVSAFFGEILKVMTKAASDDAQSINNLETIKGDTASIINLVKLADNLLRARKNISVFAEISNGVLVRVTDFNNWPEGLVKTYNVIQAGGKVICVKEIPFSESGDSSEEYDHFFARDGSTVCFRARKAFFDADCSQSALHETRVLFYDENFRVIYVRHALVDSDKREKPISRCSELQDPLQVKRRLAETAVAAYVSN